jgi:Mrp family chromosome partitioning ATPase
MIGVGLAFLRHTLDQTVRSARQIREDLGLQCLGELPALNDRTKAAAFHDEVQQSPQSRFSHNLRKVKAAISLADIVHPIRYLGITSTERGTVKSSLASNLATLYAMGGMRTLVVDADVDNSFLTARLLPDATPRDKLRTYPDPITRHIVAAQSRPFDILPSAVSDARKLLLPRNMEAFIAEMQSYDIVIFDLPPLTAGIDRFTASAALDGVVVATEWGKTPVDVLGEFVRSMHANKTRIVGVLMTSVRGISRRHA